MKKNSQYQCSFDQIVYKRYIDRSLELYGTIEYDQDFDFEIYINNVYVGFDCHKELIPDTSATKFSILIPLSDDPIKVKVILKTDTLMTPVLELHEKDIRKATIEEGIHAQIDEYINNGQAQVTGYAFSTNKKDLTITLLNENNEKVNHQVRYVPRSDLVEKHIIDKDQWNCGFYLTFEGKKNHKYQLIFSDGKTQKEIVLDHEKKESKALKLFKVDNMKRIYKYIQTYGIGRPFEYIQKRGLKAAIHKFFKSEDYVNYDAWIKEHAPSEEELAKQREHQFEKQPKISLIVACYNTPLNYLKEMIESVENQTYTNYELCIADGSSDHEVEDYLKQYYGDHDSIKYTYLNGNRGISENMNAAMALATGDYIGFFDHDDLLTPDALYEMVKVINEHEDAFFIYSDEDKTDEHSSSYFTPNFKPDFNLDLLLSVNYICHFLVVSQSLIQKVGLLNKDFDGAQDYDFVLRCVDELKEQGIYHIPKILYHWRFHKESTAGNPKSKTWAFEAGQRAIEDYYKRNSIEATVEFGPALGLYRTHYAIQGQPLISIIIPNKDHKEDLQRCVDSILKRSTYKNYEIIIVENNSTEKSTFDYYQELEKHDSIQVVTWKDEFNYSAINNFGRKYAKGDYLLFLNNDTEVISEHWLEEMLGLCQRKDVGAVGAQLIYPDHTIQHGGAILGVEGVAGHVFLNYPENELGYNGYLQIVRDYSAVTAACMMVKASVFDEVNGFTEALKVAFNDIDLCLKIDSKKYRIVYTPYAKLTHYESKSRGEDTDGAKLERFNSEVDTMLKKWGNVIRAGDPCYNPNLSLIINNEFHLKTRDDENDWDWIFRQHGIEKE